MPSIQSLRPSLAALGIVLLVYALVLGLMPKHVFWSPDEGIKFIMLRTLTRENGLKFKIPYRGEALDRAFEFYPSADPYPYDKNNYPYPLRDGTLRFPWPIWFPLLTAPLFYAFGVTGLYLIPLVSGWLTTMVAWRITYHFDPLLAPWAALLVGLGTPIFFFSLTFWEHTLVALLALAALWLIIYHGTSLSRMILLSPIVIVSIVLRLEMIAFWIALLLAFPMAAWAARLRHAESLSDAEPVSRTTAVRPSLRWSLYFFAIALSVVLILNLSNLITPRHLNDISVYVEIVKDYSSKLTSSQKPLIDYIRNLPNIIINFAGGDGPAIEPLLLWASLMAVVLCIVAPFVGSARLEMSLLLPSLAILLFLSSLALLSSQPYRSLHGIFLMAPYGAIASYTIAQGWRRRQHQMLGLSLFAFIYLAIGILMILITKINHEGNFTTGLEWGSRYLLPLYPLFAILALLALKFFRESNQPVLIKRVVTGILVVMMMLGIQFQLRGAWMLYNEKQTIANWQSILESQAQEPLVTDLWWLPANIATYFTTHEMYVLHYQNAPEPVFKGWLNLIAP